MRSPWRRLIALIAAPALIALFPACSHNDQSLFIKGVIAPPQNRTSAVCSFAASSSALDLLGSGTLDVGVSDGYVGVLAVESQLITRQDRTTLKAESAQLIVSGATVAVTDIAGKDITSFTSLSNAFVAADEAGVVFVNLTDVNTSAALRAKLPTRSDRMTILTNVQVFGETLGHQDVESNTYSFPITVCNGCLVDFSAADPAQPTVCAPLATAAAPTTATAPTTPCFAGQDGSTPCGSCLGRAACDKR